MKDKETRRGTGVAFILFLDKESAQNCTKSINNKWLFGRVMKASIAIGDGRAAEFIKDETKKKLKKTVKMKGKILLLTASVRPQISSKSKLKNNKKWKPSSGGVHQYQMIQNAQG
ncbi:hypothetical protein FD754_002067 [Muntiacus muntjak]|uniref:RRM domain-containing protein n=1 Tax=Muntiacus muntjak TaxID=9888 RepID=A0A5N3W8B4_MUNMU|nr:hypothetical protein FD754_002067 [Muntiacus muntjak]